MGMVSEFREFVAGGNVLDLAVGVIIGAAFGKIVTSLTDNIIMPIVGAVFGGVDFSSFFIPLGAVPDGVAGLAAIKEAGVPVLAYGSFITEIINFIIFAFVIFMIVRTANKMRKPVVAAPAGPSEVDLLTEIRDSLKK